MPPAWGFSSSRPPRFDFRADVILLNVTPAEIESLRSLDDLAALRGRRGLSLFTIAPHPFYVLGGSIGERLVKQIDCFDAIELCHFWTPFLNPNRRAIKVAEQFQKPLIATSDAHQLHAFGPNYTSIPRPAALTIENVFVALRNGPRRVTNPPCGFRDLISTIYWTFVAHPLRRRSRRHGHDEEPGRGGNCSPPANAQVNLESDGET